MFAWAGHRGLNVPARTMAGILFTFCGPVYMHLHAGHVMMLCPVAWAPLVMLSVDKLFDGGRALTWSLVGMLAVSMQILAGHPQTVYYTAIVAGIYALLRTFGARKRLLADKKLAGQIAAALVMIFIGAAALTAVQLFTGIAAAGESVRGPGVPKDFAAMFAFPPENVLTLLAPGFFGNILHQPYWGRCYLWEMCAFISVTGFFLALFGAIHGRREARRWLAATALLCLLLALGSRTPLFEVFYRFVPGYDRFRGNAKFIFLFALFATMLAGVGLDRFWSLGGTNDKSRTRAAGFTWIVVTFGAALLLAAVLVGMYSTPPASGTAWQNFMLRIFETRESYLPERVYEDPQFAAQAAGFAAKGLLIAGSTSLLAAALWFMTTRRRAAAYALAALACAEIAVFARVQRVSFDLETTRLPPAFEEYFASRSDDGRLFWPGGNDNQGMIYGVGNLWGDDPGLPLRYGQFITWSQGGDPDTASQYVRWQRYHRLYAMLRAAYFMVDTRTAAPLPGQPVLKADGLHLHELTTGLPRTLLIEHVRVIPNRDAIFEAMRESGFDPRSEVILEREPGIEASPPADGSPAGTVSVRDQSTDEIRIEAELTRPAVLLVTDAYHSGWRAEPADGSSQSSYEVLPANYVFRAIPLQAGSHHIHLEYRPKSFRIGLWVSLVAVLACLAAWAFVWRRRRARV
jgi:hypothetical protein